MSETFRAVPNGTIRLTAVTVAGAAPVLMGLPVGGGCTVLVQNRGTVPVLVEFGAKAAMALPVAPSDTVAGSRSIPVGGITLVRLQQGERHVAIATASGTPDVEVTVGEGSGDVFAVPGAGGGSGGGAANQYPGADYATSGKQDTGNTSIATVATGIGAPTDAATASGANTSVIGALRAIRDKILGSIAVTGTFWQATQPVSGTFWQATQPVSAASLPLPANAAQDGADPASPAVANAGTGIRGWLATIAGLLKLGAQTKAQSGSVTIATDQGNLEPGGTAVTGSAMPTGGVGLTGWLSAIWLALTTAQSGAGGAFPYVLLTGAGTNGVLLKSSASRVIGYQFTNNATSARYVKLYNKASSPTVGTDGPSVIIEVPASGAVSFAPAIGISFSAGLGLSCSTGAASSDTGATAGGDVVGVLLFA